MNTVIHIEKYLYATKEQRIILRPNKGKSFEVWVDADFSGNWNNTTDTMDASITKSRSGYVITVRRQHRCISVGHGTQNDTMHQIYLSCVPSLS